MALKNFTLESLGETKLKPLWDKAMNEVLFSLYEEGDIPGNRSISIDITFKPKDGYVFTTLECSHKTPGRSVSAIATMEDNTLKIDTVSADARQPDMIGELPENVKDIKSHKKEGAAS